MITNVPGPQVPLYAAGERLVASYPVLPLGAGHLLAIGVTSYDGDVFFGLTADRDADQATSTCWPSACATRWRSCWTRPSGPRLASADPEGLAGGQTAAAKKAAARQEARRKAAGQKRAAVRNLVARAAQRRPPSRSGKRRRRAGRQSQELPPRAQKARSKKRREKTTAAEDRREGHGQEGRDQEAGERRPR